MQGDLFAMAMPRGSGKTTIAECACLWAILYGHRAFVALIGASEVHAEEMLDSIKMELEGNDLLLEDFPEAVFPIHCLEGIANRCAGQLYFGERTFITWTAREIVMPTVAGSKASAAIIRVAGLTGRIRGMKYKRADGNTVRPSLVIIDDPQTDESARSPSQCEERERILAGAVLGLAGPGRKISGVMPCTVIRPGDLADRLLDRDKHPLWQGERTKMVYAWPTNQKLWDEYATLRARSFQNDGDGSEATEFYRQHREEMDAGSRAAWPDRYNEDELSAIQHAWNLRLRDERAFFAEYQNEPLSDETQDSEMATPDEIAQKVNGCARGVVPREATRLTAFIDVQKSLLFWLVAAWQDDFTGYVIDYGTTPGQPLEYFALTDVRNTLQVAFPGTGLEGSVYAGLKAVGEHVLACEWHREDGAAMRIERCLVDANWGDSTATVYQFCRDSQHAAVLLPSHGRGVTAGMIPMHQMRRKAQVTESASTGRFPPHGANQQRAMRFTTRTSGSRSWHSRISVAMGDRGCLSLFKASPQTHRMLADQLTAEYRVKTKGRGREVDEWKERPNRTDSHWLDCLVGAAVAASIEGVQLEEAAAITQRRPRKELTAEDIQRIQSEPRRGRGVVD